MKVIHYGSDKFIPELFKSVENVNYVKPKGGLWTSPLDSKYGWSDFCKNGIRNCIKSNCFILELKSDKFIRLGL